MIYRASNKIFAYGTVIFLLCLIANTSISTQISSNDAHKFNLLIIAPQVFAKDLNRLVEHKNNIGVSTKLVTLETLYQQMSDQGRDNPEKIKYFIKNAYDSCNISYVLLVGGIKNQFSKDERYWLPVRYCYLEERWTAMLRYKENKFISDLYFADIYDSKGEFCSWDTDNDSFFGEWFGNNSAEDILDLHPDVYVGRLPCENRLEVKIMVNKIINYEKTKADDCWFKKMVVIAGDSYVGDADLDGDNKPEGELETQMALDQMPDFKHIKLWTSLKTWRNQWDIIRAINKGCGFLLINCHGSPYAFSDHPPNSTEWVAGLANFYIPFLRNGKKLPVCVNLGCHCSMFNVSLARRNSKFPFYECINWRLVNKIHGGCIATIGNTGLALITEDKLDPTKGGGGGDLIWMFFREYGINNNTILGECFGNTIHNYLLEHPINWDENSYNDSAIDAKLVEQLVLFGDPSLKIGGYDKNTLGSI
jgi:hypothetical protein